jgi:uncharacterized protein YaaW (UPF0174 family)
MGELFNIRGATFEIFCLTTHVIYKRIIDDSPQNLCAAERTGSGDNQQIEENLKEMMKTEKNKKIDLEKIILAAKLIGKELKEEEINTLKEFIRQSAGGEI